MKVISLILFFSICLCTKPDCSDAQSSAEDAYSYADKAFDADSWDGTRNYLKKSMGSFDDTQNYSQDCGCDEAYAAGEAGYDYTRKGFNSSDWDDAKASARRAKGSAEDAMQYAEECDEEAFTETISINPE